MSGRVLGYAASDWLNVFLLGLAEGALAWLAINVFLRSTEGTGGMSVGIFAMLMVTATAVPRLCHDRGIWGGSFTVIVLAALAVTTSIAVQRTSFPEYSLTKTAWIDQALAALIRRPNDEASLVWMVLLGSAAIWWRGVTRGRPDIDAGLAMLRGGSAVLIGLVIVHSLLEKGFDDQQLSAAVLVFYTSTLLGIAMMRQEMVPWLETARWLETVLLPVALVIAPTALIIGLLTRDLSGMVDLLLDPIILLLTLVLRVVSFLLVLIAMIILVPLIWIVALLPISVGERSEMSPMQTARSTITSVSEASSSLPDIFRYVLACLILALLFAGIAKFRLRLGLAPADSGEERQRVRIERDLFGDLKTWIGHLLGRDGSREEDALAALRGDSRWRDTVRIRERYAEFLRWSVENHQPRTASTTPDELRRRWETVRSGATADSISTMTTLYDRARYGREPMTEADANSMDSAWTQLTRTEVSNS